MLLPSTAEGGGCAVMVGVGAMVVGVVAATMAERENGGGCGNSQKTEREKIS